LVVGLGFDFPIIAGLVIKPKSDERMWFPFRSRLDANTKHPPVVKDHAQ
jgi:hypothetical protein